MTRFATALLFAGLLSGPVLADDAAPHHCNFFCKVWRNVSGRVQTPVAAPLWDDGSAGHATLEPEERMPRPSELVAVHGEVLRKTRAERQREQAALADEIKQIDALRNDAPRSGEEAATAKPRIADQAQ